MGHPFDQRLQNGLFRQERSANSSGIFFMNETEYLIKYTKIVRASFFAISRLL